MNTESSSLSKIERHKNFVIDFLYWTIIVACIFIGGKYLLPVILPFILAYGIAYSIFQWFEEFLPHILGGTALFTAVMVLYLLNSRRLDPTSKITWLIVIMLLPVFGALLFWYTQSDIGHRAVKTRLSQLTEQTKGIIPQSEQTADRLAQEAPGTAALARYIRRSGCYPVFERTAVTYFPIGEEKWYEMLRQLEQAEHFIFLEYFIVDEGLMWGKILEILARKAAEGVDVRVMYDGTCEFSTLPHDYPKRLKALGIKCKMFAPVTPFVSTHYNYRDHRKILVIDGHTAFNGGVNLADEYINHIEKFGHWKDTAIMLKGEAVRSFMLMFLQMWGIDEKEQELDKFLSFPSILPENCSGYVLPYGDCPLDNDRVGERVYMDIYINHQYLFGEPKTKSGIRRLSAPPSLMEALRHHKVWQMENKLVFGKEYQDNHLICCRPDGRPYHPASFSSSFGDFLKRHELKHIRWHDLRHTNATLMLQMRCLLKWQANG